MERSSSLTILPEVMSTIDRGKDAYLFLLAVTIVNMLLLDTLTTHLLKIGLTLYRPSLKL